MKESLEGERGKDPPGTYSFPAEAGYAEPADQKGCAVVQSQERVGAVGQAKTASEESQGPTSGCTPFATMSPWRFATYLRANSGPLLHGY